MDLVLRTQLYQEKVAGRIDGFPPWMVSVSAVGLVSVSAVEWGSGYPLLNALDLGDILLSWKAHLISAARYLPSSLDDPGCTTHTLSRRTVVSKLEPCKFISECANDYAIQAQKPNTSIKAFPQRRSPKKTFCKYPYKL